MKSGFEDYRWLTLPEIFKPNGVPVEDRDVSRDTILALRLKSSALLACTGYNARIDNRMLSFT